MRIAVTAQDGKGDFIFPLDGAWNNFKKTLLNCGHCVVNLSDNPDAIIFNNFSRKLYLKYAKSILPERRFLVAWEPPSNLPLMYKQNVLKNFKFKFFPSPIWAEKYAGEQFDWPQGEAKQKNTKDWDIRKSKWCIIQSNRWSFHDGELYSIRRIAVSKFSTNLDLYGRGWNLGILQDLRNFLKALLRPAHVSLRKISLIHQIGRVHENFRGEVVDKVQTQAEYKYALVIENNSEYVSEKLIDALLAGCITVYVGPPLEKFKLNENMVVRADANLESIAAAMKSVENNQMPLGQIRTNSQAFFGSIRYQEILNNSVLNLLAFKIGMRLK